jgi:hypothetical protein
MSESDKLISKLFAVVDALPFAEFDDDMSEVDASEFVDHAGEFFKAMQLAKVLRKEYPGAPVDGLVVCKHCAEFPCVCDEILYDVFTRTWWKENKSGCWPNNLEPCPGEKTYLANNVSRETALLLCDEYNATHEPGRLSLKAEFTEA